MRSLVLIASTLTVLAATSVNRVADEVVLLQVADTPPAKDDAEFQYSVMCDEMHGCHYSYLPASSTLAPYQLICDDEAGCRFTGVTPPPTAPPAPQMPMPDLAQIQKLLSPFRTPDMSKVQKALAQLKPSAPPSVPQVPVGEQTLTSQHTPAVVFERPQHTASATGFFVPDNKMCCVDGPLEYVREKLAKIKASPIGDGYDKAQVLEGACPSQGYDQGPKPEECFPLAKLWYSKIHAIDPLSEPFLMAGYAKKHGVGSVVKGMSELCRK